MNNLLLLGSEYNHPKQTRRMPWNNQSTKHTGVRVFWGTVEGKNAWQKDMPFKVKLFHRIHSMVDHEGIGGDTPSWRIARRRLRAREAMWPGIQKEWY